MLEGLSSLNFGKNAKYITHYQPFSSGYAQPNMDFMISLSSKMRQTTPH
jgi:hypothetical protein